MDGLAAILVHGGCVPGGQRAELEGPGPQTVQQQRPPVRTAHNTGKKSTPLIAKALFFQTLSLIAESDPN